ncbi:hypothetical protein GGI25_003725 [Coemansia spiralis]|uniref:RNA polymerase II-associated factor 1 homolog n=1 Tax=Coemansia spiralis TaxID=417178 RepID=A0A9W8G1J4_9FUNG|nr:hypothetical protein GGI26_003198 [Coemansia sp. RSA 1358]KAJ2675991.1 hypothetical protein GGI25_003725 [Coemansia spiralis]
MLLLLAKYFLLCFMFFHFSRTIGKEFLCKVRYQNPLPPVPFPPKLLPIPPTYVDPNAGSYSQSRLHHYVEYRHTTLEEATPYPMIVDADYGMPIDPCLLGAFDEDKGVSTLGATELDEKDRFLLNLPSAPKQAETEPNGLTESNSLPSSQLGQGAKPSALPRTASNARRAFDHSVQGQLRAIEESFAYFAKYNKNPDGEQELLRNLKHPTNDKLHAVESYPLFPDEELWPNIYTAFSMDVCPEPEFLASKKQTIDADEYKQIGNKARESLVFRPRVRQNNIGEDEQWIECFLPEDETTAQNVRERLERSSSYVDADQGVEYRFEKSREYDMPVRPNTSRQDLYMIVVGSLDGSDNAPLVAKYVPIKSKVMLKNRQLLLSRMQQHEDSDDPLRITSLDLQLRDFSEEEIQERAAARNKLHEAIKEEIVRVNSASRNDDDIEENVDVGGNLFDSDNDDTDRRNNDTVENGRRGGRHRRTPSYSSSVQSDGDGRGY